MKLKVQHFIRERDRERLSLADLNKRKYKIFSSSRRNLIPDRWSKIKMQKKMKHHENGKYVGESK